MLKQVIDSETSIYNLIDFLINKDVKKIFLNFSYIDDDEKPSIIVGGIGGSLDQGIFNQIFLHPDISKRESVEYYPFINSCFNLSKKINIQGKKNGDLYSIAYENKDIQSPYLNYQKVSKSNTIYNIHNNNFVLIKCEFLEDIFIDKFETNHSLRKPHAPFYNLLNLVSKNIPIRYHKLINEGGYQFYLSTKTPSKLSQSDFSLPLKSCSPFQEEDPQCRELEETHKNFGDIDIKVKPFLISPEKNNDNYENSEMHGIYFMHENKVVYFDKWNFTSIKNKRILAKDQSKIIRMRVKFEGDISFGNIFSINPINGKIKISNELIKMIDVQIEKSLSSALLLAQNIAEEDKKLINNIAKSDALAAYKELVYSQKYNKENAIRKICDEGEMVKYNFIEEYLRGAEV